MAEHFQAVQVQPAHKQQVDAVALKKLEEAAAELGFILQKRVMTDGSRDLPEVTLTFYQLIEETYE